MLYRFIFCPPPNLQDPSPNFPLLIHVPRPLSTQPPSLTNVPLTKGGRVRITGQAFLLRQEVWPQEGRDKRLKALKENKFEGMGPLCTFAAPQSTPGPAVALQISGGKHFTLLPGDPVIQNGCCPGITFTPVNAP